MSGYTPIVPWANGRDAAVPTRLNAANILAELDHMGDYVEGLAGGQLAVVNSGTVTTNQTLNMSILQEALWIVTLGATGLTLEITGWSAGKAATLVVKQDASGNRVLAGLPTAKWEGGAIPSGSTGSNAIDIRAFFNDGTNTYGFESGTGMA